MTTYFIDFQNGCDENDGLRPETPFRTQHPELLKPDDTVLFRDVYKRQPLCCFGFAGKRLIAAANFHAQLLHQRTHQQLSLIHI